MDAAPVAALALAQCKGMIAEAAAKAPRLDVHSGFRPVRQASAALTAADVLTDAQEAELANLQQWAKRQQKVLAKCMDTMQQTGTPADMAALAAIQNLLGKVQAEAENTYQRAWHARAAGLGQRAA